MKNVCDIHDYNSGDTCKLYLRTRWSMEDPLVHGEMFLKILD